MTDHTTTFLKRLKGITLSDNERLQMRERLVAYIDMHPVTTPAYEGTPFFTFFASRRFSTYASAFMILIVMGGTITLAADSSVPGDALYSMKIHLNEPVMIALATSPTTQANVAADLATRRVDEAVVLANRGSLTAEKQAYLSTEFDKKVAIAAEKTDRLAQYDAAAATNVKENFAASLAGEAQALGASRTTTESGQMLAVVVTTSEQLTSGGEVALALAEDISAASGTVESSTEVQADTRSAKTMAATTLIATASTKLASKATTTKAFRSAISGRFSRNLRVTSATLHNIASSTLNTAGVMLPKVDVAIPTLPTRSATINQTGEASGGFRLGN